MEFQKDTIKIDYEHENAKSKPKVNKISLDSEDNDIEN